ncbi:hypothetical protein RchiOBHm_Chr6g0271681 [Rosa chinensis]|uniref:Uncharacterized protein n=1 Tax=Rosa chinensis TaxID=74649 RepID=A0A2P6PR17_ROSCH|nr:hypothetical protein RchiOBHm_Chr6g0271681 [Rosa chinensis]
MELEYILDYRNQSFSHQRPINKYIKNNQLTSIERSMIFLYYPKCCRAISRSFNLVI